MAFLSSSIRTATAASTNINIHFKKSCLSSFIRFSTYRPTTIISKQNISTTSCSNPQSSSLNSITLQNCDLLSTSTLYKSNTFISLNNHHSPLFPLLKFNTLNGNYSPPFSQTRSLSSLNGSSPGEVKTTRTLIEGVTEFMNICTSLSKIRLSSLVILTTMFGNYLAPTPFSISNFLWVSIGTGFAISSANSFNQIIELEKDKKMHRTSKRKLASGKVSVENAILFGVATAALGSGILYSQVNTLSAVLAFSNIILYALVYTPLKQVHPINTWIGSFVGAIPPMIGWAAATGHLEPGAWALGLILYIWQIPHFLALSWYIRDDYQRAGYKMLSVVQPTSVPKNTFYWSLTTIPLGAFCWAAELTTPMFIFDSNLANAYFIYYCYKFYQDPTNMNARKAFMASLWHLVFLLLLVALHKKDKKKEEKVQKIEE